MRIAAAAALLVAWGSIGLKQNQVAIGFVLTLLLADLAMKEEGFIEFLLYFIIAILPWLVFFGLIIWLVVKFARRRKAKKEAKPKKE